ncbi:DUF6932 family protein [Enhygromyxa salina]|uniref:DUF6932 family protein n=1 Tax=Enhygromyxa salina TaxID=215803 RepID=UPI0011BA9BC9|nr:hypothetical protein [Enhygromyxa salina]
MPVPDFDPITGCLPPGIFWASWEEFTARFGGTPHRESLLLGLEQALIALATAGCGCVYVDGSFVTSKVHPNDFDACWDITGVATNLLDPVLTTFDPGRATQKAKYGGELFPAHVAASPSEIYLEFFQTNKATGARKGIVGLNLTRWKS